jgi:hypothetical protein
MKNYLIVAYTSRGREVLGSVDARSRKHAVEQAAQDFKLPHCYISYLPPSKWLVGDADLLHEANEAARQKKALNEDEAARYI